MRRGIVIGGVVLVVVGLLLVVAGYELNAAGTTTTAPGGSAIEISPKTIGDTTLSVSWTGVPASGTVYLISGSPTCASTPSGIIAQASGDSGSLSGTLSPGTTYSLYACNGGNGATATFTYSASGLSILMVVGIVLAIVGLVLLALGFRGGKAKAAAAAPPAA